MIPKNANARRAAGVKPGASVDFTSARQAFAKMFQRIPVGFAPELTAVCPGEQLLHEYPQDATQAARFLDRYSHLDLFIGADLVPIGRREFVPWARCFRVSARNIRPDHKRFAEQAGAALLVGEVNSTEWLSRTDHFFVHGPTALYVVFTHPTITDLERSLARLIQGKISIRVEQAMNHESPVNFRIEPSFCFPCPRLLSELAFDLSALAEVAA